MQLLAADISKREGGFARNYRVELTVGDQTAIELHSEEFDPVVVLIGDRGFNSINKKTAIAVKCLRNSVGWVKERNPTS